MTMTINEDFIRKTFYITPETAKEITMLKALSGHTITVLVNNAIESYAKLKEVAPAEENNVSNDDLLFLTKKVKFIDEYKRTTYYIKKENWSLIEKIAEERNKKITIVINDMLDFYLKNVQYEGKK